MSRKRHRRISVVVGTVVSVCLPGACGSSRDQKVAAECSKTIGGVQYFLGSLDCLERLAQEPMSGYWQVGHEYSVFYSERPKGLWELDPVASWLTPSEEVERAAESYLSDGQTHLLKVEFIGSRSDRLGFYGSTPSRSGVYMKRLVRLSEVKE